MVLLRIAAGVCVSGAAIFATASTHAQTARIFVSAKAGFDSAICGAPTAPCRTFQQAHGNAAAGGEIAVMDPGDYGRVSIIKPIRIVNESAGTAGVFGDPSLSGPLVSVSAGAGGKVVLRGLTFVGFNPTSPSTGVFLSSGDLRIERCSFRRLDSGVDLEPSAPTDFSIADSIFSDNFHHGVLIAPSGAAGAITGVIRNVKATGNVQSGVFVAGTFALAPTTVAVTIVNSILAHNLEAGLYALSGVVPVKVSASNVVGVNNAPVSSVGFNAFGAQAVIRLAHSVATGNARGVALNGGLVESYGDNNLRGNTTNIDGGALTPVGKQ